MASNISLCDICNLRHLSNPSTHWCQNCDESLCSDCKEHHTLLKATRGHIIIPIADYQKLPSFITDIKQYCAKHNEKYQHYCQKHECPICYKCVQSHVKCAERVIPLELFTENSKESQIFYDLTQSISDLETNIKQMRKCRENNLAKVTGQSKAALAKIREIRERVNCHLDSIEQKLIRKLKNVESKCSQEITGILKKLNGVEDKLSDFNKTLQNIKQHASELQVFFAIREIENELSKRELDLKKMMENKHFDDFSVTFEIDKTIEKILSDVKIFGTVSVETVPVNEKLINRKSRQAQILTKSECSLDIKYKKIKKFDSGGRRITGCTILLDGRMAFTEHLGKRLVIRLADGNHDLKIPLKASDAFDVTVVDVKTVAVSFGAPDRNDKTCIQVIDINSSENINTIDMESWSYGVVCVDEKLLVCGYDPDGIYQIDLNTNEKSVISSAIPLNTWSYITVFKNKLYVTNDKNNTITCCDEKGSVIWTYKDDVNMRIPRGVSVDNNGNVYVASERSNNVTVILHDGTHAKQILGTEDGLDKPCALHFDRSSNRLLVANYQGTAYVFDA